MLDSFGWKEFQEDSSLERNFSQYVFRFYGVSEKCNCHGMLSSITKFISLSTISLSVDQKILVEW